VIIPSDLEKGVSGNTEDIVALDGIAKRKVEKNIKNKTKIMPIYL
jgi:hypothetical protein